MVEPTAQAIPKASWEKGNKPLPDLTGRQCFGAVDLGWLDDLAAFWLIFPPPDLKSGIFYTLGWAFCPLNGARDFSQGDWQKWRNDGTLIATPGTETNADEIHKIIKHARTKYKLKAIALDQNNARQFGQDLQKTGIEVCGHGQKGIHYNEPLRSFKSACNEGRIIHGGNELLGWCVENMVVAISGGLMRPAKEHSRDKIDPAVAMLMAYSIATLGTGKTENKGEARVRYA
jgi:phage terminase large subunit-like protein